jgi:hypothetical protein
LNKDKAAKMITNKINLRAKLTQATLNLQEEKERGKLEKNYFLD